MISVMAVIENFPISIMKIKSIMNFRYDFRNGRNREFLNFRYEIGKFSITAITEIIPKVHNGLNFHNGNWEILDYGHYGSHS
jgi:hypothetical protein